MESEERARWTKRPEKADREIKRNFRERER